MDASIQVAEVRPARGAAWLAEAFRLFRRAPLAWIGLCSGWLSLTLALIFVPFFGWVIANFLQPVFFASFALAARKQAAGERIVMGDLFEGFKRNMRPLVNVGALLLLSEFAILSVMVLLGLPLMTTTDRIPSLKDYADLFEGREWIVFTGLLLTGVVKAALWFAPALIAFHDMTTMHAIRWSVYAALANLGAMLVYGAVLMVLFFLGMLPWLLGLLVVVPMMVISTYVGYKEVFAPA